MRLLDLFSGAGGAGTGYARAGFEIVGVDIRPQPRYPFEFVRADAIDYLTGADLGRFDAVHASPPCQRWCTATRDRDRHPDLIGPVRALLAAAGLPYVIENVPGAPLHAPIMLCGRSFGLAVKRHRLFESDVAMISPGCACSSRPPVGVYGDHAEDSHDRRPNGTRRGTRARTLAHAQAAMGIDWMTWAELTQAIPPAYTELVGAFLTGHLARDGVPS